MLGSAGESNKSHHQTLQNILKVSVCDALLNFPIKTLSTHLILTDTQSLSKAI